MDAPDPDPTTSSRAEPDRLSAGPGAGGVEGHADSQQGHLLFSAVIQLDEPYVLSVPDTHDRNDVVNVFKMRQELRHYIRRRTTGTAAGRCAIAPPGWKTGLPAGVKRLDVSTKKFWLCGRLSISEGEDKAPPPELEKRSRSSR